MNVQRTPGPWRLVDGFDKEMGDTVQNIETPRGWLDVVHPIVMADAAQADGRLIAASPAMRDLLERCAEYLDGRADVVDGDDGQPKPNAAMSLYSEIEQLLAKIDGRRL